MAINRAHVNTQSVGLSSKIVTVSDVMLDQNSTICVDDFYSNISIPLNPRRTDRKPQVGEKWIVDREFGKWSFVCPLLGRIPSLTGNTGSSDPVLINLITILSDLGYIKDDTT